MEMEARLAYEAARMLVFGYVLLLVFVIWFVHRVLR